MTKPIEPERVEKYLVECLEWLGLGYVKYHLRTTEVQLINEEACASVVVENRGMDACLHIAVLRPWADVKRSVIHECVHIATWETRNVLWNLEHVLAPDAYKVACEALEDAEERLVLRLERALMGVRV